MGTAAFRIACVGAALPAGQVRLLPKSVTLVLAALLLGLLGFAILFGVSYLVYYLVTLPLRREERARLLLAMLDSGFRQGKDAAQTLSEVAQSRDPSLGGRFQELAAFLEQGRPLALALQWVQGYVPRRVCGMLAVGEEVGDVARMLPACRRALTEGRSKTRVGWRYAMFLFFGLSATVVLLAMLRGLSVYVLPPLLAMLRDMNMTPPAIAVLIANSPIVYIALLTAGAVLVFFGVHYIGGPRLPDWMRLGAVGDWLALVAPWHRKRLRRDFSATLAILLDAGVPEERALTLAAKSTGNRVFLRRSAAAVEALAEGHPLTEAVARLDRTGEFRWRLANAAHANATFLEALRGWHDALDAKAFQLEQAFSQWVVAAVVLTNGVVVALIVISVFDALVAITKRHFLW